MHIRVYKFLSFIKQKGVLKFLIRNRKFWKNSSGFNNMGKRIILSEAALGYNHWSLAVSSTATIVASAFNARVLYLTFKPVNRSDPKKLIQRSFSKCIFKSIDELIGPQKKVLSETATVIFNGISDTESLLKLKYKGIPIGEQVYDAVMKKKTASVWRIDEKVKYNIIQAIFIIEAILKLKRSYEVVAGFYTHTTSISGIFCRTILSFNKPFFTGMGGFKVLYKYNKFLDDKGRLDIHIKIPPAKFEEILLDKQDELLPKATTYLRERLNGNINDWDAMQAFSSSKVQFTDKQKFCTEYELNPSKPLVFIMLHAMNDDPHVQIQHIFKDYYDWFIFTLKQVRSINHINWIFKQHPMIKFYPDDSNLKGLFDLVDDDHILYLDEHESFNSSSIPHLASAIVTCAGTAGLEYSSFGIPGIITAGNAYAGFGICHEPKSKIDYVELLKKADKLPKVNGHNQNRAKILFYLIFKELIPGFLEGMMPYMNYDEIIALSNQGALNLVNVYLDKNEKVGLSKLKNFIVSVSQDKSELYFKL